MTVEVTHPQIENPTNIKIDVTEVGKLTRAVLAKVEQRAIEILSSQILHLHLPPDKFQTCIIFCQELEDE